MCRGRPPQGPKLAEKLDGSAAAKERLQVILETLAGARSIPDACAQLGVGETRFHELRKTVLAAAAAALEPRPAGRPTLSPPAPSHQELTALQAQLTEMKIQLEAAQIRAELALVMPHLFKPPRDAAADKKKAPSCPDSKPRGPGTMPGTPPSCGTTGERAT
jgi:hypothetical protein